MLEAGTAMQCRSQEYVKCIAISLYIYMTFPSLNTVKNLLYFTFILVIQPGIILVIKLGPVPGEICYCWFSRTC